MKPAKQRFSRREKPLARNGARKRLGRRSAAGAGSLWIRKPDIHRTVIRLPLGERA